MNVTFQEQIAPDTAQAIVALASAHGQSVNDYLRKLLGLNGESNGELNYSNKTQANAESDVTPYALIADLVGSVDSSIPDPDSPPRHTAFGQYLLEKHRRQAEGFK